jgi:hypothetical protein
VGKPVEIPPSEMLIPQTSATALRTGLDTECADVRPLARGLAMSLAEDLENSIGPCLSALAGKGHVALLSNVEFEGLIRNFGRYWH